MKPILFLLYVVILTKCDSNISGITEWSDLILQHQDERRISELKDINLNALDAQESKEIYYETVPKVQNTCQILKKIGGHWEKSCGFWDGEKLLCMEKLYPFIRNKECLVYSFGLADDWDFEILMAKMGKFRKKLRFKLMYFHPSISCSINQRSKLWR